jgi:hypothetical protein
MTSANNESLKVPLPNWSEELIKASEGAAAAFLEGLERTGEARSMALDLTHLHSKKHLAVCKICQQILIEDLVGEHLAVCAECQTILKDEGENGIT